MYLYLLENETVRGYDTYAAAVVAAESEAAARMIHPSGLVWSPTVVLPETTFEDDKQRIGAWTDPTLPDVADYGHREWSRPEDVIVRLIGVAAAGIPAGPVCIDYNAG